MTKYLIFDFDGVLADSLIPIALAFRHSKPIYKLLPLRAVKYGFKRFVDRPVHARSNRLSEFQKIKILEEIQAIGRILVQRNEVKFFGSFVDQIRDLQDYKMAIVSSGSEIYLNHFCKNLDLPVDYVYGVETSLSKEDKILKVCQNWGISAKDCWYFTDTLSDVKEIWDTVDNSKIIGCGWGFHGAKKLLTSLDKDKVLLEFEDIRKVLNISS